MRDVRDRLERWLASLPWDEVRGDQEHGFDPGALPSRTERIGDWEFSFPAWPRKAEDRSRPGRAIAAGPSDGAVLEHSATLRDRLEEKAAKYGSPSDAVVIAVRLDRIGAGFDDVDRALLGPTIGRALPGDPATVVATGRRGTGLFRHASGRARNRHVAGILVFSVELRPWSITRVMPTLWVHPDPERHLPADLPWRRVAPSGGDPEITEGTFDPGQVFELPDRERFDDPREWPGEPFEHLA